MNELRVTGHLPAPTCLSRPRHRQGLRQAGESRISGLYAIADSGWNPLSSMSELVLNFLNGGCRLVQLRMKGAARNVMMEEAKQISRLKRDFDFAFVVNDYADIAVEVGADAVHVGESDEPVVEIKKRFGERLGVGYSSHSIDEAKKAAAAGADYVSFGAIFPTKTKGPGHPVQGLERLKDLVKAVDIPVVAIGGIGRENIREVLSTGVDSVAMITALSRAPNISEEAAHYVGLIQDH